MKITTTSRHYELTPALKEHAESKIKHLTTYFDHIVNAHIIFKVEKYRHMVEVTLHANGKDFVSHEESEDMYVSVDRVAEKLERQILKHKGKRYSKKSPRISEMELDVEPEAEDKSDGFGEILPADPIEFPALTLIEAAVKLKENGKEFSVFSNKENNRLTVLFKREDGTFGFIEAGDNAEKGLNG